MRLMFDVLGAPESSGGMRLYAESVINAWIEVAPNDELTVVGASWVEKAFAGHPKVTCVVMPSEGSTRRIVSQLLSVGRLYRMGSFAAILSVSPMVTPLAPKSNRFVVIHDWRHRKNPGEFGRVQLVYRKLWPTSVAAAAGVFVISRKTAMETAILVPRVRTVLAENGADHVRSWLPFTQRAGGPKEIVTFGHHSNKRPELLIHALALLVEQGHRDLALTVLGARGAYRETLVQLATRLGVDDYCRFPGFVSDAEYQRCIQSASVVALVSTDEGFGLPVSEAGFFGIPCIATTDSGLTDVHGEGVYAVAPTAEALAEGMLSIFDRAPLNRIQRPIHSWRTTAFTMRSEVVSRLADQSDR